MRQIISTMRNVFLAAMLIWSAATTVPVVAATDSRASAITCSANASSPIIFYGQLPQLHFADEQPSFVQIFPTTDISEFFFDSLNDRLHGVTPTSPPGGGIAFQQHRLDMTISTINMQSTGPRAIVSRKGAWACKGFSPGKYSFLATVHMIGKSQSSNGEDTFITQYYRADINVGDTNKPAVLVPVTPFRLVGQTPP